MASYFNVYQVRPGLVEFTLHNLLGHVDGHITVWMSVDSQRWCWAKMGDFANLVSIRPNRTMAPRLPTKEDEDYFGALIRGRMAGTCDINGRFLYPEDQKRADELQAEFDALPADAWQRDSHRRACNDPWHMPWGTREVRTGSPFGGDTCELLKDLRDPRWPEAAKLLGITTQCST